MNTHIVELRYSDFVVRVVGYEDDGIRSWDPGEGEYNKNLFATYMYRGHISEYRLDNGQQVSNHTGETFINTSIILDYSTIEKFEGDAVWLCFSSYKPISATLLRLRGSAIVPAGMGAYNVLGRFEAEEKTAKAFNYLMPRDHDVEIVGDAKVLLLKYGEFINVPTKFTDI